MHLLVVCDALGSGMFLQKHRPFINHLAWALKMCEHQLHSGGEMERVNERRGIEIKISLNKDIILVSKPVLPLKTDEEET